MMKSLLVVVFVQLVLVLMLPTNVTSLQPIKTSKPATKLASTTTPAAAAIQAATSAAAVTTTAVEDLASLVPPMEQQQQKKKKKTSSIIPIENGVGNISIWKLALAGALTTLTSDMVMHPIDCIKTLQQSSPNDLSMLAAAHYIHCQLGGIQGFYRGFLTYAGCDAIAGAIKFGTYETLKQKLQQSLPSSSDVTLFRTALFGCAALSFVTSSVIAVPGELLKQQLQVGHYSGAWDAVASIWQVNGIAGFYQGYDSMFLRDVPYTALELGLYDLFKGMYMNQKQQQQQQLSSSSPLPTLSLTTNEQICIAGLTGGITGFLTNPIDVIKTKLMVDAQFEGCNFVSASMITIQEHGWGALFAGADARVAWLVPLVAMYLPTYDFVKKRLAAEE